MTVRIIPAAPKNSITASSDDSENKKIRAAAYCRVSTELEEQESSYEAQVSHYRDYISSNENWVLAGIYADEGISGTGTRKREEFNRMIADCEKGRIDLVITKSISRFARNTLDCLQYIRKLKALNIPIYFEKENINTLDARGEMLITIMASIAQQESQSISQNVRMGIQYRFQQGKPMLQHTWFLGYSKDDEGNLVIVPEEADIVRRIYREFLEGMTVAEICARLEKDHIKTGAGRDKWYGTTVVSILKNEKYMGDLLLQKGFTVDFLSKNRARNTGQFPQYYVENAHEPIVPREVFMQVQGEFIRRENVKNLTGKREMHRMNLPLNNKILCSVCGSTYRRFAKDDPMKNDWRCRQRLEKENTCSGRIVKEQDVLNRLKQAFEQLPERVRDLEGLRDNIENTRIMELDREISKREAEISELEQKMSDTAQKGLAPGKTSEKIEKELANCRQVIKGKREEFHSLLGEKAEYSIQKIHIQLLLKKALEISGGSFESLLEGVDQDPSCRDYADFFMRTEWSTNNFDENIIRYVKAVIVYPKWMVIRFKAGLDIIIEDEDDWER